MSINLDNSRHGYNLRCKWWDTKIVNSNLQKLDYRTKASGIFYAREYDGSSNQMMFEGDLVKIDTRNSVIETQDDVVGLDNGCLVYYLGQMWIVDFVKSKMIDKRSEYDIRPSRITWITLRNRGE